MSGHSQPQAPYVPDWNDQEDDPPTLYEEQAQDVDNETELKQVKKVYSGVITRQNDVIDQKDKIIRRQNAKIETLTRENAQNRDGIREIRAGLKAVKNEHRSDTTYLKKKQEENHKASKSRQDSAEKSLRRRSWSFGVVLMFTIIVVAVLIKAHARTLYQMINYLGLDRPMEETLPVEAVQTVMTEAKQTVQRVKTITWVKVD